MTVKNHKNNIQFGDVYKWSDGLFIVVKINKENNFWIYSLNKMIIEPQTNFGFCIRTANIYWNLVLMGNIGL